MYQHLVTSRDSAAGAAIASTSNDTTAPSKTRGAFQLSTGTTGIALPSTAFRWVAKRAGIKYATGTVVQLATQFNLLDAGTGAGNKLKIWEIGIGLSTALTGLMGVNCVNIDENELYIPGVVNQAMTLEADINGAANTTHAVFLQGFFEIPD